MKPNQFWCVGRNYREHAAELGNTIPDRPLIFLKSGGCLQNGSELAFPSFCQEIHHELEVVLLLGEDLKPTHWTLGLDFTERKIQTDLKKKGEPWELSKSFIGSAALGAWKTLKNLEEISNLELCLKVNGVLKQQGQTSQMIFKFDDLLQYLKAHFPLSPGDAVFTGTPSGVGPIAASDVLNASCGSLQVQWKIK